MNYVYVYKLKGIPIYVGIGEEDGGKFKRAHNMKSHKSITEEERAFVGIDIVARNLSRAEARRTEMTLVQVLGSVHVLNEKHARALRSIGYPANVQFGSLEQWAHAAVIHPEGGKDIRHFRKTRPLADDWKKYVETWE